MNNEAVIETKTNRKKLLLIAGVIVLIGAIIGLNVFRSNQKAGIQVKTAAVSQKKMVETVLASGKVYAPEREVIYSQVSGWVKASRVKLGQTVKTGQVLLELEIPEAEHKLMQAQASFNESEAAYAKAMAGGKSLDLIEAESVFLKAEDDYNLNREKYQRNKALFEAGAISKEQWETSQAEFHLKEIEYQRTRALLEAARSSSQNKIAALQAAVESNREALRVAQVQAEQKQLKSPLNGKIMALVVQRGDKVNPYDALVTVGDTSKLNIKADIAEADANKVKPGQKVIVNASAVPGQKYHGRITELGLEALIRQKAQGESSSIPVIVTLPRNTELRPGYNVELTITTRVNSHAVVIPFEALVEKQGKSWAYVIRNGKAYQQKIETGMSDYSRIEVISGLKKGDKVVLNPPPGLKNGSEVKVK
ncbi:efflux RND transporter periplasmic adaptor subunit [Syntrophomonas palmitatica]|uniref:efflux RND transporter periplasmic adaptor subunit n=1 Tax=Syntrophomonas palmitatica TaxID=402877 RepID=UPI0006D05781|nr:efflux RND transporter periplasmic adaptor subunit [Syntrophomonas palmitatica]